MKQKTHELFEQFVASTQATLTGERLSFLRGVQEWLEKNLSSFSREERNAYHLESYVQLTLSELPIAYTDLDPVEEFDALRRVPPSSLDGLAMRIRDILWDGIVLRSSGTCSRCEEDNVRLLLDNSSQRLVYACDTCGWSQWDNGVEWHSNGELVPAPMASLRLHGLL